MAHVVDEADLRDRLSRLDLAQKVRLLTGADMWALHAEPAAGLRRLVTSDGPAGVRGERWDEREPSANVPSPTALAATWDEERIHRLGGLLAAECRRKGVGVLLAPTVNLHRTPAGGRHFECFSEDPLLTGRIGTAYVRGLQEAGIGATVKHFVANDSETERFTLDARVDERTLRELYLAPFEAICRDARPWAVMAAYNAVNGQTMTESPMLHDVLEAEWGFDGVVMSDWFAARTTEPAARAGLDLVMPGPAGPWGDALAAAVRAGAVPEAAVDRKVLRILRLAARVGALEGVAPAVDPAAAPEWAPAQVAAELRAAAAAGFVLARNDGTLPLEGGELRRVAVLGPNAAVARTLGGGSATVFPAHTVAPLEGLQAALGADVEVTHAIGVRSHARLPVAARELLAPDGAQVDFLAADGTVLGSERRPGTAYAWQGIAFGEMDPAAIASVRVRATLRAAVSGEHVVGCSGVGRFRLWIDGTERFAERLVLRPGADLAEAHMHPPQHGVPVQLEAGRGVELVLRHDVEPPAAGPAGDDGPPALAGIAFQLNVDPPARGDDEELEHAAQLAADADVAVVVVGTTDEVESEGFDRTSLALPGRQDELVRRVAAANSRTVVVVNAGAPVLLPWTDEVAAVLLAWFPGQEFGHALADVLLGEAEPGGRLPTTWPSSEDGLPSTRPENGVLAYREGLLVGHRGPVEPGREPRFAFGHGLGYTSWEYAGMEVAPDAGPPDPGRPGAGAWVRVRVRNAGSRPGREVVQVYASRPASGLARPERWLAGFAAVRAEPGEEVEVEVRVPWRSLAHWDAGSAAFAVEPGGFMVAAGRSSRDLRLTAELRAPAS
jgi:beta-glucosidase